MAISNTGVYNAKNGMLLAYIANRIPDIHLRKLLKIVYLIDEAFIKQRGYPLTWFNYYAWAKGPVAREVYKVKDGSFEEYVSAHKENLPGEASPKWVVNAKDRPLSKIQLLDKMMEFSSAEINAIDALLDKYADLSADELTELTHQSDSLWSQIVAENALVFDEHHKQSDVKIPLTRLIENDECLLGVYEDAKWSMEFQNLLQ
ncbi:MAG: Panacea domain-containing protein [Bacteroides sp.]|nr:Panacea domain-containing protein [Ruminococcus flavefaciens]MCM1554416.1 Panacea domain-containing protein [Bacteroides sp.]